MRIDMRTNIRTVYVLIAICGIGLFLATFLDALRPSPLGSIPFGEIVVVICVLGLMSELIVSLIIGLVHWRKSTRWWMGPALLCIAFLLGLRICGDIGIQEAIGNWWFKKHIGPYVEIVDSIQSSAIPCNPNFARIGNITNLPPHVRYVSAARCPDGAVLVEFRSKTVIPLSPIGHLFKNYGETNNCITANMGPEHHWHYLRHITGNWYEFWY